MSWGRAIREAPAQTELRPTCAEAFRRDLELEACNPAGSRVAEHRADNPRTGRKALDKRSTIASFMLQSIPSVRTYDQQVNVRLLDEILSANTKALHQVRSDSLAIGIRLALGKHDLQFDERAQVIEPTETLRNRPRMMGFTASSGKRCK